jgi:hypothetical protein
MFLWIALLAICAPLVIWLAGMLLYFALNHILFWILVIALLVWMVRLVLGRGKA